MHGAVRICTASFCNVSVAVFLRLWYNYQNVRLHVLHYGVTWRETEEYGYE